MVEVKSFLNKSKLTDFYAAKGQYDMYRLGMEIENLDKELYLAIDEITYKTFFSRDFIRLAVEKGNINILVFDNELKEITTWITH